MIILIIFLFQLITLIKAQQELNSKQNELVVSQNQHSYVFKDKNTTNGELVLTDEFKQELYKHEQYFDEDGNQIYYGEEGEVKIIIK